MTPPQAPSRAVLAARLRALRMDGRYRIAVVASGVVLGLGVGMAHWLGLVLGGALVALPAPTVHRGLAAGLGLGVLQLVVFAGLLAAHGALGPALATGAVGGLTVAVGLGGPVLGSLVRVVV